MTELEAFPRLEGLILGLPIGLPLGHLVVLVSGVENYDTSQRGKDFLIVFAKNPMMGQS